MCGECVDTAHADAVKTTADLVGAFVELTTGVEHGHDDLQGALVQFLMLVDRDASAVVLYGAGTVCVDGHLDVVAETCHSLVDGVVHGLIDEMVQTFLTDVANIHSRTLAHGFQTLQHLDVGGGVIILWMLNFCHFCLVRIYLQRY